MKIKRVLLFIVFIGGLVFFPTVGNALNLMESLFLKITIIENGTEHEWEYTSPGKYEYEKGNHVIKTAEAKEEMLSIVRTMQLSEKAVVDDMAQALKKSKYPNIERLDIRWMTGENKLYTWVWEK